MSGIYESNVSVFPKKTHKTALIVDMDYISVIKNIVECQILRENAKYYLKKIKIKIKTPNPITLI